MNGLRLFYRIVALTTLGALPSCDQQDSRGETFTAGSLPESDVQKVAEILPGIKEQCIDKIREGGILAMPEDTEACFEMTEMRQWDGLWRYDFEGTQFCPAPATECRYDSPGDRIWFDHQAIEDDPRMPEDRYGKGRLYRVSFVGRRTKTRGHFGHLGGSDHEIVAHKLLSIELIEEPANLGL